MELLCTYHRICDHQHDIWDCPKMRYIQYTLQLLFRGNMSFSDIILFGYHIFGQARTAQHQQTILAELFVVELWNRYHPYMSFRGFQNTDGLGFPFPFETQSLRPQLYPNWSPSFAFDTAPEGLIQGWWCSWLQMIDSRSWAVSDFWRGNCGDLMVSSGDLMDDSCG